MCGIVGAVCERDVYGILIEGLKRLEYRGYDSAGLSLLNNGNINTQKTIGKVVDLENLFDESLPSGTVGIAHTRWATHGVPSSINSHPHTSGQISVVHNGIIENQHTLKEFLKRQGVAFKSETDSEVLVQFIAYIYRTQELDFFESVRIALGEVVGAYGILVINKNEPDKIVAAKMGSPLIIGLGDGENYIGSDISAIMEYTRNIFYLDDGEVAEITTDGYKVSHNR